MSEALGPLDVGVSVLDGYAERVISKPHCRATQPLPPALLLRDAGVKPLEGFE